MKRIILFILMVFSTVFCYSQYNISQVEVSIAAINWMTANKSNESNEIRQINTLTNIAGNNLLYEIVFDSTTMLFSGYKSCVPILATYNSCGGSLLDTTNNDLPEGLSILISDYIHQITLCVEEPQSRFEYESEWSTLIDGNLVLSNRSYVAPLIKTQWDQDYSNSGYDYPAYNYYCVSDSGCSYYPVGCGAVAMGQVMNYWNYPILSYNLSEQIDWCNLTNTLDYGTMTNYDICRDAIAKFLFNCAKNINTVFGCYGSNSNLDDIYNALINIYGYSALRPRQRGHDDAEWLIRILSDIDEGRPVIYRGADANNENGHFFILDGYDSDGKFHINWGWGNSNLNFYAYLGNFAPPGSNYNYYHWAIFKLTAPYFGEFCNQVLNLGNYYLNYIAYLGSLPHPPYDFVPQTMTKLISSDKTLPNSWRTIPTDATATYQAHEEVHLRDGFTVERGADFTARIVPCSNCDNRETESPETTDTSDNAAPPETASGHPLPATDYQPTTTDLYPNPTDGEVTVGVDGEVQSIIIYNMMGRPVGGWNIRSLASDQIVLDVSPLPAGTYILHIQTPMGTTTKRLVVTR